MDRHQITDEEREVLRCPVCWEDYTDSGDLVPRLFPCTHTACHKCVQGLQQWPSVRCPKCRAVHRAKDGVMTFPENQYILSMLKFLDRNPPEDFERCATHCRPLILHCKNDGCKKDICHLCLLSDHKTHDVVDILNEKMEKIKERLKVLYKDRFTEQRIYKISKDSLDELLRRKSEMVRKFDEMIETTKSQKMEALNNVNNAESQIDTLYSIKVKIENVHKASREELDTIEHLGSGTARPESMVCRYYDGKEGPCGKLGQKTVDQPKLTVTSNFSMPPGRQAVLLRELSDGTLALFSRTTSGQTSGPPPGAEFSLSRYKSDTKSLFDSSLEWKLAAEVPLEQCLLDVVEITLTGKSCLVLCFREQKRIEFRDLKEWKKVILSHSTEPKIPVKLCLASASMLLYVDASQHQLEVNGLDCKGSSIYETDYKLHLSEGLTKVTSMVYTKFGGIELLLVMSENVLEAYDVNLDMIAWMIRGKLPGMEHQLGGGQMVTDGRGHLFVSDTRNNCVQMLSTDGRYFGVIYSDRDQGSLRHAVAWSSKMKSLILHHVREGKECIDVIKVEI